MAAMVTLKANPGLLNMHRKEPQAPLGEGSWVDWVREGGETNQAL